MSGNAKIYRDDCLMIEQFTGLHDKNGKEIYEGDVISLPTDDYLHGDKSEVQFYAGEFHITLLYDLTPISLSSFETVWQKNGCFGDPDTSLYLSGVKVLSNIHDTPELVQGEGGEG